MVDGDQDPANEADNPPQDDDDDDDDDGGVEAELCPSLDRLATRRVTDFSQVKF